MSIQKGQNVGEPSREEPPALTDVQIAQSANALEGFITQVVDSKMSEQGAWQKDRVQALYEALMRSGVDMPAVTHSHHLAIMLAIAMDEIAEGRTK